METLATAILGHEQVPSYRSTGMAVGVPKWIGGLQVDAKVGYIWPNLAYKWVTSALSSL